MHLVRSGQSEGTVRVNQRMILTQKPTKYTGRVKTRFKEQSSRLFIFGIIMSMQRKNEVAQCWILKTILKS